MVTLLTVVAYLSLGILVLAYAEDCIHETKRSQIKHGRHGKAHRRAEYVYTHYNT